MNHKSFTILLPEKSGFDGCENSNVMFEVLTFV